MSQNSHKLKYYTKYMKHCRTNALPTELLTISYSCLDTFHFAYICAYVSNCKVMPFFSQRENQTNKGSDSSIPVRF